MANANTIYLAKTAAPLVNPTGTAQVFTQVIPLIGDQTVKAVTVAIPDYESYPASNTISTEPAPAVPVNAPAGATSYRVNLKGRITTGVSANLTVGVQVGSSTTTASNSNFLSFTALVSAAAGNSSFSVSAIIGWDPTSGFLAGATSDGYGGIASTAVAPAAATARVAVNLIGSKVFLVPTAIFSASNAANEVWLDEFSLEQN